MRRVAGQRGELPLIQRCVSIRAHPAGTYRFDVLALKYGASGMVVATTTSSITLEFVERRRLRIRLVRIHYRGTQNNVKKDIAPRSVQEFWDATDYAQRVLPIPSPGFEIVRDSVEQYDGDFTRIDPGAHDLMWSGYAANRGTTGNLLNILDTLVGAESLAADVIYVAIYSPGVNMSAFAGWAVGRWIISDLDGATLAHELAHKNGVPQHAPCGGPQNVDPNFPDFPSFSSLPAASIGEVGFDWSTMQAYRSALDTRPHVVLLAQMDLAVQLPEGVRPAHTAAAATSISARSLRPSGSVVLRLVRADP